MSLTITNETVEQIPYGDDNLIKLKYGQDQVWPQRQQIGDALEFNSPAKCNLYHSSVAHNGYIQYTRDDLNDWEPLYADNPVEFGGSLGTLYIKGTCNLTGTVPRFHSSSTVPCTVGGYVSAIFGEDVENQCNCTSMFSDFTNLVDASGLVFPEEMHVEFEMYSHMFFRCTGLLHPPALPMKQLTRACYYHMFSGCTSLQECPELPASSVPIDGYHTMFQDCTSLKKTCEFKAEYISDGGYNAMFQGCTSLIEVEPLNLYSVPLSGYSRMFENCTSLVNPPELNFAYVKRGGCYCMFKGCTSLKSMPDFAMSTQSITQEGAFEGMFSYCENMEVDEVYLPAPLNGSAVGESVYAFMFSGCKKIKKAAVLIKDDQLAKDCIMGTFSDCDGLIQLSLNAKTCPGGDWENYASYWTSGIEHSGVFRCPTGCTMPQDMEYATAYIPTTFTINYF